MVSAISVRQAGSRNVLRPCVVRPRVGALPDGFMTPSGADKSGVLVDIGNNPERSRLVISPTRREGAGMTTGDDDRRGYVFAKPATCPSPVD